MNHETFSNPMLNGFFELHAGTSGFSFLRNYVDGSQPIAISNSLDQSVEFFGDLGIANVYNETELDATGDELSSLVLDTHIKTEVDNLLSNINLTGSENIDTTNNQISLTYPLKNNNEALLNPRVNGYFETYAAPNSISILQHVSDGSQPIAMFNSLDKSVEFFGGLDIPNFYDKAEVGNWIINPNSINYYTKNLVDTLIYNTNLVGYYTETDVDTQLTDYAPITYAQGKYMTLISIT